MHDLPQLFADRGWTPFPFQRDTWTAYGQGRSGLIHAPTGVGKTLAAALGPMREAAAGGKTGGDIPGPVLLWCTPLRALATDTAGALRDAASGMGLDWRVELRTSDTSSAVRQRQKKSMPQILVSTPESLSVLLSYRESRRLFRHVQCVVVDEWHELLGSKRGVQTELVLARLRTQVPTLRIWGLSATLGNLEQAREVLLPGRGDQAALISADIDKPIRIESLLPETLTRFPWSGHLGRHMVPAVLPHLEQARTTLLFTNTRAQAELWFAALWEARPDWRDQLALHHGSIDRQQRLSVEAGLRQGDLRCVVATSSLDLGVDFSPVDQIIQVGSPKGVARLLQRAGRSGHSPGAESRILCVPAHAFELVEFAAARHAAEARHIEPREPVRRPLDLLAQHLVTLAAGPGFRPAELRREIQSTFAFRDLSDDEWQWTLTFISKGGDALSAYDQFQKVAPDRDGVWRVTSQTIARFHRLSIGTIAGDGMMRVTYTRGPGLGMVEERFLGRLKPGDTFLFAGRALELVRVRDMTAYVRNSRKREGRASVYMGGRMPLSSHLSDGVLDRLQAFSRGEQDDPELRALDPILRIQAAWSRLPAPGRTLVEVTRSREGHHTFVYPFAGRLVHEGLATLLAWRMTRRVNTTLHTYATDYGLEFLSPEPLPLAEPEWREWVDPRGLSEDLADSLQGTELARRQFRDIARVAGLVFQGYPGRAKSMRQLQASSGLFYDVFKRYDPANRFLRQAREEVFRKQFEESRLSRTLAALHTQPLHVVETERLTPLAFPVWSERLSQQVSSESWTQRIERMVNTLERSADNTLARTDPPSHGERRPVAAS